MLFTIILLILAAGAFFIGKGIANKLEAEKKKQKENGREDEGVLSPGVPRYTGYTIAFIAFSFAIASNFIIMTPSNMYAQFNKRILGPQLKNGQIIATDGEMGPQGWMKREGISIIPFVNFIYSVSYKDIVSIPKGQLLILTAKDGLPLGKEEFFAPDWFDNATDEQKMDEELKRPFTRAEYETRMLNAEFFLTHGGKKGPQVNVLSPGKYAINTYLWDYEIKDATVIPTGNVGVVTSKVGEISKDIERSTDNSNISVPLVDKGYIGIWKKTLTTGSYYLNPEAYHVQIFDMKAQIWLYKGGFKPRENDLFVAKNGEIGYKIVVHEFEKVPASAADSAIAVKTKDKYTVYIEARLQIQPDPKHASRIVGGVGDLTKVEDKIITPAVRSILRNVGMKYDAVDFVDKRVQIEAECKILLHAKAQQAGVPLKEFFFGNIDIPPAVLTPQKVEELSKKMEKAYIQQDLTYKQLIKTNETKATADQQSTLVKAKIKKEKAEYEKQAKKIEGEGIRLYTEEVAKGKKFALIQVAKGQKAQKDVLGAEKTFELQMWKETINFLKENPDVAKAVPQVYINKSGGGNDSGFEEGAAIMGIQQLQKAQRNIVKSRNPSKK
jgi:regulator of protease activity HflC (stomatin/prohibitin superfamily)